MSDKQAPVAGVEKKTVLKKVRKVVKPKTPDAISTTTSDTAAVVVDTPPRTPTTKSAAAAAAEDPAPQSPAPRTPPPPPAPPIVKPVASAIAPPMSRRLIAPSSRSSSSIETASQFDAKTITEFKEAFSLIDQDADGVISKGDLRGLYTTLGVVPPDDAQLEAMLAEAPGPLNFAMFLTLFGERLTGCDPEEKIIEAFKVWDKPETGFVSEDLLLEILHNQRCEPLTDDEIKAMYKGKPPIKDGQVDFKAFAHQICTGVAEEMGKM